MSESEIETITNPAAPPPLDTAHDSEARLTPEFVAAVIEKVEDGDTEGARALVEPLHPADVADLFELAPREQRQALATALGIDDLLDADVLAEMNDWVREQLIEVLSPHQVAELATQLDTDDAVAIIEDMEEEDQRAVLRAMEPDDRAAIEEASVLSGGERRPSDAARSDRGARALEGFRRDRLSAVQ
jgi:magnesium transporter